MKILKLLSIFFIATLLVMASFGTARAANTGAKTTPTSVTGVVQNVVIETDPETHVITVLVTILDENNETQDETITLDAALTLGLVSLDVNTEQIGLPLTLDPLTVIPDEGQTPPPPEIPIVGTINAIETQTDPETHAITVVVTLEDENLVLTPYRLSLDTGISLELVSPSVVEEMLNQTITINPEDFPDEDTTSDNPIDKILSDFLATLLGVDPVIVSEYHDQGMGYGVIAQAGILSYALDGDNAQMQTFLDAKISGDYSGIVLPDGSTPTNWGQLRKGVMDQEGSLKNLGNIVSGHTDSIGETTETTGDTEDQTITTNQNTNVNGNSHKPNKSNLGGNHPNKGKGKGH